MDVTMLTKKEREYLYQKIEAFFVSEDAEKEMTPKELEYIYRSSKTMEQKIIDTALFNGFAKRIYETRNILEEIRNMLADTYPPSGRRRARRRRRKREGQ